MQDTGKSTYNLLSFFILLSFNAVAWHLLLVSLPSLPCFVDGRVPWLMSALD